MLTPTAPAHRLIRFPAHDRYDANNANDAEDRSLMVDQPDPAELRTRLEAGEWLRPGEIAAVLGIGRTKVHQMLRDGTIGYRHLPGSRHRQGDPKDVLRLLREAEIEHRAEQP